MAKNITAFTRFILVFVTIIYVTFIPGFSVQVVSAASVEGVNESIVLAMRDQIRNFFTTNSAVNMSLQDPRVVQIRTYFESKGNLPGMDYADEFVAAADHYDLVDWRLTAAIAMVETTGCEYPVMMGDRTKRPNNCFGYGNNGFDSITEGIWFVTKSISGNHEPTQRYYKDASVDKILGYYNSLPLCSDRPWLTANDTCLEFSYSNKVKKAMNEISSQPIR